MNYSSLWIYWFRMAWYKMSLKMKSMKWSCCVIKKET